MKKVISLLLAIAVIIMRTYDLVKTIKKPAAQFLRKPKEI